MSQKDRKLLITQKPNQSKDEAVAEKLLKPSTLSSIVADSFKQNLHGDSIDFVQALQFLEQEVGKVQSGDLTRIEEMLLSQAVALELMFTSLARRAKAQEQLLQYESHMRFALKAQNQSRATLQALIQLKQPNQTTFVKQANIAQGHQQINNLTEKNINPQNELLRESYAKLDNKGKAKAKRINSKMEALDKINRSQDSRG